MIHLFLLMNETCQAMNENMQSYLFYGGMLIVTHQDDAKVIEI